MATELHPHHTFVGLLGILPAVLCLLAFLSGMIAVIVRVKRVNFACGLFLAAIGMLGLGITSWRLFQYLIRWENSGGIEPGAICGDAAIAFFAAGAVLPSVAVGLVFVAVATLLTRDSKREDAAT